jgi:hypothetical protein
VVTYLSFSVPAVIGGAAATAFGLRTATFAYGAVVMALSAVTTMAVSRRMARIWALTRHVLELDAGFGAGEVTLTVPDRHVDALLPPVRYGLVPSSPDDQR